MPALRDIVRGEAHFNIIGRFRMWATISGIVLVASLGGLFGRGLNLSIDFKGGTSYTVPITATSQLTSASDTTAVQDAQNAVTALGVTDVRAQIQVNKTSQLRELFVRTPHLAQAKLLEVQQALAQLAGQTDQNQVNINDVGPTWGRQISDKALRGLIVFLVLVTIYISIRFEPKMAAVARRSWKSAAIAPAAIFGSNRMLM